MTRSEINLRVAVSEKVVKAVQSIGRLADAVGKLSVHAA